MTKQEHITYWINTSEHDWKDVQKMFKVRSYVPCLFFTHLVFEKLAKAIWVKNNEGNTPPRTHNINSILQQSNMELSEDEYNFFNKLNRFQMENRYPDYVGILYQTTNRQIVKTILLESENHRLNLLNSLNSNEI